MLKPYYETKNGKLYHGDCLKIITELEPVDLVLTDPPYGINLATNYKQRGRGALAECKDYAPVHGDNKPFDPAPFLSISKHVCLWGANYYADKLPPSSGWLVWDKKRPDTLDQATVELAWTNFVKGARRFECLWNGMIRAEKEKLIHPTQKPVSLMIWVLGLRWTPTGTVLDPFFGSGSTGVACEELNRKWIGIEISEEYCELAAKRIERETRQVKLFAT
ncbi:MAG: site-specific DNA-methyltransferase [Chloroflexota bacterium]|nr:site-specific DNA-methyltransferase [Chloroflexota bacterium]